MTKDEARFELVRIYPAALVKMLRHADEGGDIEVMGLLFGTVEKSTFTIFDAVPLPAEGTHTRISATALTDEWMVNYALEQEKLGNKTQAVGWYHTHPGYACWLSEIDIDTHRRYQEHMDPWVAIVVDPTNKDTIEIGAFRLLETASSKPTFQPNAPRKIVVPGSHGINNKSTAHEKYYSIPIEIVENEISTAFGELLDPPEPLQHKISLHEANVWLGDMLKNNALTHRHMSDYIDLVARESITRQARGDVGDVKSAIDRKLLGL